MEETVVLIVGAGPSGLGIAACLTKKSIPYILLEKEDCCASLWKKRAYDRCNLHLAKQFCSLPLKPHANHVKRFMNKCDFINYIDDYVNYFNINPYYFHRVESATFDENKGKWLVESNDLRFNVIKCFVSKFLIVATGENSKSYIPSFPGLEEFRNVVVHSSEYKSGDEFKDKNVLVVGGGNSGMEICYDLCNSGANTSIVIRSPVHVFTKEIIFIAMTLLKYLSIQMVDKLAIFAGQILYGDLSKYGIYRPKKGPFFLKATTGRSPVIDVGTIAKIKSGKIKVVPCITSISKDKVTFENGIESQFDAIIFATGYKSAACDWLKDYDFVLNDNGFPKNRYPNHWKGKNGLYCAGLARMGLQGAFKDAIAIANDIELALQNMVAFEEL
ncbi:unnamed protein product [Amaranthus hypochondriacus]